MCRVIGFHHRKAVLAQITNDCEEKVTFYVNPQKSNSNAAYEYFNSKLVEMKSLDENAADLLNPEDEDRVKLVLKYIEDLDLRQWSLPDTNSFRIGLNKWHSKLNCITNPYIYEQLLKINSVDLIFKGNSYICSSQSAANKLLGS